MCNKKLAGLELRAVYSIDWKLHSQSPSLFGVDSPPPLSLSLSTAHTFPRVRFSAAHMAAAATAACCMHAWKTSQNDVMTLIYLPTPPSATSFTLLLLFCPFFLPPPLVPPPLTLICILFAVSQSFASINQFFVVFPSRAFALFLLPPSPSPRPSAVAAHSLAPFTACGLLCILSGHTK